MEIRNPIIPSKQTFAKLKAPHELDYENICVFAAIGFFLDQDTYWKDKVVLTPASNHQIDDNGYLINSEANFKWNYEPHERSFEDTLEEFSTLFETIILEQTQGEKVILPLSGGLDSRTQAAAFNRLKADVFSYSYNFKNGYPESKIAKQIAKSCDFNFKEYTIPEGYLWNKLDNLTMLNKCYSDFTAPRQMALYEHYDEMGDVFSLGHWGDVLFDSMKLPQLTHENEIEVILGKLLKKGGLEFAIKLWETWQLDGDFESYLRGRIDRLLLDINIDNTNAKLRAFKSLYWAPRWTSVNLSIFESVKPITLPYFDDRMCQFICNVPEKYLKDRQLQIAYIKTRTPELAKITWQDQRPYNLNNFHLNRMPHNLAYKVVNKLKRTYRETMGNNYVQRNWELQFVGKENENHLKDLLFDNNLDKLIPKTLVQDYYNLFSKSDKTHYAHSISMLLVMSKFNEMRIHE